MNEIFFVRVPKFCDFLLLVHSMRETIITTIEGLLRACNIVAFYAYTRSYFGNYNSEILFDFDDGHYFLIRLIRSVWIRDGTGNLFRKYPFNIKERKRHSVHSAFKFLSKHFSFSIFTKQFSKLILHLLSLPLKNLWIFSRL